jgi:hypothetical protein
MGKWTVEFRGGVVRFQVTDTSRTASYACTDGEISGAAAGGTFRGHYDASKGTLTWNGHEYERVN